MIRIAVLGGTGYLATLIKNQNNIRKNKYFFFSRKKSVKSHNIIELDAEISVIEPMGHETVVICDSNYGELTGKVESNSKLKENMTVKINVGLEKVYLFDKNSEKNLNL